MAFSSFTQGAAGGTMHGIIFGELKRLVDAKLGGDSWRRLIHSAGLGSKVYMPIGEYPDADAVAIVSAIAKTTGKGIKPVLEEFGEFIAPNLIALYRHMVKPEWRTLDLLENTEATIHRVVRLRNPGAHPPQLKTVRSGDEVVITYSSQRRMCGIAIGIVRGLARHYNENVAIDELSCMLQAAASCQIRVRRI
jgi:predicted hydrocarbon binding protein